MSCSDDPALFDCVAICGGILGCCGRDCREQCSRCQVVNVENSGAAIQERIERKEHCKHPCEKRLYCEHPCAEMCSQDHTCTTVCQYPCRQVCAHARCRGICSQPCAPCQEPCTWFVALLCFRVTNPHTHIFNQALSSFRMPSALWIGSYSDYYGTRMSCLSFHQICARPPCDIRCPEILKCGHRCPSGTYNFEIYVNVSF